MDYLDSIDNDTVANTLMTISLIITLFIVGADIIYRKMKLSKNGVKSYCCGNNSASEITKDNEDNIKRLISLENLKLFKQINDAVTRLENTSFKPDSKIAFSLGEEAKEIVNYLEFLESKNAKVIAANFNFIKEHNESRLSEAISVTVEDENGVIYFLFPLRLHEIAAGNSIYTQYGLSTPFVLREHSLTEMSNITDASDVFIPKDKYGEPLAESISKTFMTEDIDKDTLVLTFYWNKDHNFRTYYPLTIDTIK